MENSNLPTVILLLLFNFLCVSQGVPFKEQYFDQTVDHFNFALYGEQTFKQRYLVQDQWWKRGDGPIFFYTGNEGNIEIFWNNTGFVFDIAPEFGALVIFAEHRFYGKSLPFGVNTSFESPYIGLLTVEQALADYAVLVTNLKQKLGITNVPVIAFGGSYGGMLSAWMRFKYPNVVAGSIAGSAPIFLLDPEFDHTFFFQDVTKDFDDADNQCFEKVKQGFIMMQMYAKQGKQGLSKLSQIFRLCRGISSPNEYEHLLGWVRNSFTNLAMMDYPYPTNFLSNLPAYPVKLACDYLTKASNPIEGLATAAGLFYNGTSGSLKCFDVFEEFVACADPTGCGIGPDSYSWDYQACTEIQLPQGSNNETDFFPVLPFNNTIREQYCQQRWGVKPRLQWGNIQFWGREISSATNIVFSNGDLDPWRRGGVLQSPNPSITTILIKGGAHHLDLRASNPKDPQSVIDARNTEKAQITKWIKEHYSGPA